MSPEARIPEAAQQEATTLLWEEWKVALVPPFLPSLMVMACTKPVAAPLGIPCPSPTPTGPQLSFPSQNSGIRPTSDSGTQTEGGESCMETYVKAKATRAPLTTMKSKMFQRSRK